MIEESFVRGGGKGGQKINKTANCVLLKYPPLELTVRCQADRKRTVNRFLALRELVDQIEMKTSPETSQRLKDYEALRKKKARSASKAKHKYGTLAPALLLCLAFASCAQSRTAKRKIHIPGNTVAFEIDSAGRFVAFGDAGELLMSAVTIGETVIVRDSSGRPIQQTLRSHIVEIQ